MGISLFLLVPHTTYPYFTLSYCVLFHTLPYLYLPSPTLPLPHSTCTVSVRFYTLPHLYCPYTPLLYLTKPYLIPSFTRSPINLLYPTLFCLFYTLTYLYISQTTLSAVSYQTFPYTISFFEPTLLCLIPRASRPLPTVPLSSLPYSSKLILPYSLLYPIVL